MIVFIILSLLFYTIVIKIWYRWYFFSGLKVEIIALTIAAVAFNLLLGLLILFDALEANPTDLIHQLTRQGWALTMLAFCLFNTLFYSIFTIVFLSKSVQQN